jgi:hypothetical protein
MDLATLRATVRRILFDQADPSASRWSNEDLNRFFNEALLEVSRSAMRRKKTELSFLAGEQSKPLPADMISLDGPPQWRDSGGTDRYELARAEEPYPLDDATGSPEEYWLLEDGIYLRPIPEVGGTLTLVYFKKFPVLVNDTDVPEPQNVDGILIAYAMWQALDFDGSPLAQVWQQKFIAHMAAWAREEERKYRRRPAQVLVVR